MQYHVILIVRNIIHFMGISPTIPHFHQIYSTTIHCQVKIMVKIDFLRVDWIVSKKLKFRDPVFNKKLTTRISAENAVILVIQHRMSKCSYWGKCDK